MHYFAAYGGALRQEVKNMRAFNLFELIVTVLFIPSFVWCSAVLIKHHPYPFYAWCFVIIFGLMLLRDCINNVRSLINRR